MISTSGFGINVLPQVYQASPENLSINPNRLTQGMLEAFEVNDKLNKLRAFQLQQEELNANRAARIAKEQALLGHDTTLYKANESLIGPRTALEGKRIASDINIQPRKAGLESLGIDLATSQTKGKIEQQPFLNDAGMITARSAPQVAELDSLFSQLSGADKVANFSADRALEQSVKSAQVQKALADAAQSNAMAQDINKRDARALAERTSKETIATQNNATRQAVAEMAQKKLSFLDREEEQLVKQLAAFAKPSITTPEMGKVPVSLDEITGAGFVLDPKTGKFVKKGSLFSSEKTLSEGATALLKQREIIKKRLEAIGNERAKIASEANKALAAGEEAAQDFSAYEGKELKGPDGNLYVIKNGVPVLKQ